jgi:hypothetical protein
MQGEPYSLTTGTAASVEQKLGILIISALPHGAFSCGSYTIFAVNTFQTAIPENAKK